MSDIVIRKLLLARLDTLAPTIDTVKENGGTYAPVKGTRYQRVFVLQGETEAPTLGDGFRRERGLLQVSLYYPEHIGFGEVGARAEAIKTLFKRGTTLQEGLVRVQVYTHPYATPQGSRDGFFLHVVSVPFTADIHG